MVGAARVQLVGRAVPAPSRRRRLRRTTGSPRKVAPAAAKHAAALEELEIAPLSGKIDKQGSVRVPLPDAEHWTRVKFWGVPSLVGFRYGKDHHAIVAAVVTHVDDNTAPGACTKSFEAYANPLASRRSTST